MIASAPRLAVPPGRAGRLWLERRLAVARRGADLLDRKLQALAPEAAHLRAEAAGAERAWEDACREARRWQVRVSLLGGERAIRLAAAAGFADVRISHAVTMGARHPAAVRCAFPGPRTWEDPSVSFARRAHADALAAAARCAVAAAAARIVEAEARATRYRLRAIRDRWIPRLEQALAEVRFALEEQERADGARLRQALRRRSETRAEAPGRGEAPAAPPAAGGDPSSPAAHRRPTV